MLSGGYSVFVVCGLLIMVVSLVAEHGLWGVGFSSCGPVGLVAPRHVGSSRTRDRTCVPCTGRWILSHWTTREVLRYPYLFKQKLFNFGCTGSSLLLGLLCRGSSLAAVRGLLLWGLLLLQSTGSRVHGCSSCCSLALEHRLVVTVLGLSCSVAYGIILDQGLNPHLLHWQTDSLPLSHQGSPVLIFKTFLAVIIDS